MIDFHVALFNEFNLRAVHQERLLSYYVLHWRYDYLIRKLEDDGTLKHGDVTYVPIWLDKMNNPMAQCKLSFRKVDQFANQENAPNIVLIRAK